MRQRATKLASLALALSLVTLPLVGCGDAAGSDGEAGQANGAASFAKEVTPIDTTGWQTVGDALAVAPEATATGYDDQRFVCILEEGDNILRVEAEMEEGVIDELFALDWEDPDYDQKFSKAVGGLKLVSAQDITSGKMDQAALEAYKGKTGKELSDAGFTFVNYYFYGGDETGATMENGYFAYNVTFDVSIGEDDAEDEGASIQDAKVKSIEYAYVADSATMPTAE